MVEAAGIEPASKVLRKERWRATSVARARFSAESVALESPGVLSLGDILETAQPHQDNLTALMPVRTDSDGVSDGPSRRLPFNWSRT